MDARRAPERIRLFHCANQLTDLWRHTRSPRISPTQPALPTPVAPETLTMPADDGLGSNNVNDRTPIGPAARQPDPEQPIGLAQARSFGVSLVDCQLLAKRQILKDETPAARESQVQQPNEPEDEGNHCYRMRERRTRLSRAYGRKLLNLNGYVLLARHSYRREGFAVREESNRCCAPERSSDRP